jgi:hypothetical protein
MAARCLTYAGPVRPGCCHDSCHHRQPSINTPQALEDKPSSLP